MYLENVVVDALDPQRLGRFWSDALGCVPLTDQPGIFETRLSVPGGPELDLCFQPVTDPPGPSPRLHLDLAHDAGLVDRVLAQGARHLDVGQGEVPWVVLADPEGNAFCVLEERATYAGSGPLAALSLHSADPDRDAAFWAWLTGWTPVDGDAPRSLRHPSGLGPLLELVPEQAPSTTKNRLHLDLRLEAGDDAAAIATQVSDRGGRPLVTDWGDLPWRSYRDPSGNELCLLPART